MAWKRKLLPAPKRSPSVMMRPATLLVQKLARTRPRTSQAVPTRAMLRYVEGKESGVIEERQDSICLARVEAGEGEKVGNVLLPTGLHYAASGSQKPPERWPAPNR